MSIPVANVVIDVLMFTTFSVAEDIAVAIVFIDAVVGAASDVVVGFVPAAEGIAVTDATSVDIKFLAWLLLLYGERR